MAESIADRMLPHDLHAERALLGAAMVWADVWPRLASAVRAEDFYRDAHRRIFAAMETLVSQGVELDLITVKNRLAATGDLDEVGGPVYLAQMTEGIPAHSHVRDWADIVTEKSRLRAIVFATNRLAACAYEAETPAAQLVEQAVQDLLAQAGTGTGNVSTAYEEVMKYAMSLDGTGPADAMATGFSDLDEMLAGGVRKGELIILAGRPGSGKTSLGMGIAKGLAKAGHPTVLFSLEMKKRELAGRLLSWDSRVDQTRMRKRFLGDSEYARIAAGATVLQDVPLYLEDCAATLTEISAWCERLRTERGVTCAVVDYLQLMLPEKRSSSREAEVAAISRGLKRLAKDRVVIALSQLNRSPEDRRDNRPRLSDLRESGTLEQDCDIAALVFRADQYDKTPEDQKGTAEVIVAKNRQGATGTVKLAFLADLGGSFENLAQASDIYRM